MKTLSGASILLLIASHPQLFGGVSDVPCNGGTEIYYINGIFTLESDAAKEAGKLAAKLSARIVGTPLEATCIYVSYAYNQTHGINDLLQAYGQLLLGNTLQLWSIIGGLTASTPPFELFFDQISKAIKNVDYVVSEDVNKHLVAYQNSVSRNNKVILIGHSQGNLYANLEYNSLTTQPPFLTNDTLKVIAVATPDSFVAGFGPYTTLFEDVVASFIFPQVNPAVLPPNTSNGVIPSCLTHWGCHLFIDSYLDGPVSRQRILDELVGAIPVSGGVTVSHDEGPPNTLFGGAVSFTSPQTLALRSVQVYLHVSIGKEGTDTQGILLDSDNFNQQLLCATDVRSATAWGAISGNNNGALTTVGPFYGTQCNLIQGHHYTVVVHSTDLFNNYIGLGGYSGDSTIFYQISLGTAVVQPLTLTKVTPSVTNNKAISLPCPALADASVGHQWFYALSNHAVNDFTLGTVPFESSGTGPKPCTDNNYVFDLSTVSPPIPPNTDVYITAWSFGGVDFQIVDQNIIYYGVVCWDGSVATVK